MEVILLRKWCSVLFYFSDVWSEYYCLARGNHFCSQSFLLLVSEEKFVWFSEEEGVTYVCLRCVVSSLSVVGYIKGGWRWWRWSRSKGVVMNSFYLFRNSEGAMRGYQFIAVFRITQWITKLCFINTTTKVLYLQLWIFGLPLVLQDSWSLGLLVLETQWPSGMLRWQRVVGRVWDVFKVTV